MTDAKAPERVYGFLEPDQGGMRWEFSTHPDEADTEYIRANIFDALAKERDELAAEVVGYKEWAKDVKRLTRQLDVEMHGDGAAKQASLCDLIGSGNDMRVRAEKAEAEVERLRAVLSQFQAYVIAGCTDGTIMRGGEHHNPIWAKVACALQRKEGNE